MAKWKETLGSRASAESLAAVWGDHPCHSVGALSYARNAEGGLSFYANGLPVGAIANRDLIRLIQQAAECLQVTP